MVQYLSVDDIFEVHKDVMGRAGRWPTPRQNERGLAAALLRVRLAEVDVGRDVAIQAGMLTVGLAQSRPFEDSNMETATTAMLAFLGFNNLRLRTGSVPVLGRFLRVMSEEHDFEEAARHFVVRLRGLLIA
jgi:prophage maintenance system killer protein